MKLLITFFVVIFSTSAYSQTFLFPFISTHGEDSVSVRETEKKSNKNINYSVIGGAFSGPKVVLVLTKIKGSSIPIEDRRSLVLNFTDPDRAITVKTLLEDTNPMSKGIHIDLVQSKANQNEFEEKDINITLRD